MYNTLRFHSMGTGDSGVSAICITAPSDAGMELRDECLLLVFWALRVNRRGDSEEGPKS